MAVVPGWGSNFYEVCGTWVRGYGGGDGDPFIVEGVAAHVG